MNPLLLDIPESFDSERLTLRCPRAGEGAELNRAIAETFPQLRDWLPWARNLPTPEESEEYTRRARCRFLAREELPLYLWLRGSETLVGASGLHRLDWSVPRFEIGYWCRQRFQGQGYVSEAVRAIIALAFGQLAAERVEIRCDPDNARSIRIPERLGFALEGRLRNHFRAVDGQVRDTLVYSLIEPL
jgi:RimJ/RimL family protein N-acetyltransferase